jgi:signal transduction histidine kinase
MVGSSAARHVTVMRILIVDGSRERRLELVQILSAVTNVVVSGAVSDMRTALHAVADARPDVIVTGSELPDGDGAELIANVRRLAHTPSIVVVGGAPSDEERERYLAAGVDRYVERTDDPRALQIAITTLRRRAQGSIPIAETQRMLGRMTSGVVHDLNNYLHVLDVTLRMLRRQPHDPQLWEQSEAALQAMTRLSAMLLGYARGSVLAPELLDLGAVVRETLTVLARVVPPNVEVVMEIAERLPPLHAVRAQLEQLVLNIVINSVDAMGEAGGALKIAVRKSAGSVLVLDISDTGPGIAPSSANGESTKRPGSGLGLAIAQSVVERHRGALSITSRESGGTKVVVMLPTANDAQAARQPS